MDRGRGIEEHRGYVIYVWTGPSVDAGSMKRFSVSASGSFTKYMFDTVAEARAFVQTARTLVKVTIEVEGYVPMVTRPTTKVALPTPFALVPPVPTDPVVCARCGVELHEDVAGRWLDATGTDECGDGLDGFGVHTVDVQPTEEQIEEWVRFELHANGSLSGENPLSRYSFEPTECRVTSIEEVR